MTPLIVPTILPNTPLIKSTPTVNIPTIILIAPLIIFTANSNTPFINSHKDVIIAHITLPANLITSTISSQNIMTNATIAPIAIIQPPTATAIITPTIPNAKATQRPQLSQLSFNNLKNGAK